MLKGCGEDQYFFLQKMDVVGRKALKDWIQGTQWAFVGPQDSCKGIRGTGPLAQACPSPHFTEEAAEALNLKKITPLPRHSIDNIKHIRFKSYPHHLLDV